MRIKCARCGATKRQVSIWTKIAATIGTPVVCCLPSKEARDDRAA